MKDYMENFETEARTLKQYIMIRMKDHFRECAKEGTWIQEVIEANGVLAGSAISSIYHGEEVNDYDIYFKTSDIVSSTRFVCESDPGVLSLIEDWNSYDDNEDIPLVSGKSVTNNAVTFQNSTQFILMGTLEQCRPTFDFIHCMPYYDFATDKLYISSRQLYAIKNKYLITNPQRKEKPTFERYNKFISRGWKVAPITDSMAVVPSADLTKVAELV